MSLAEKVTGDTKRQLTRERPKNPGKDLSDRPVLRATIGTRTRAPAPAPARARAPTPTLRATIGTRAATPAAADYDPPEINRDVSRLYFKKLEYTKLSEDEIYFTIRRSPRIGKIVLSTINKKGEMKNYDIDNKDGKYTIKGTENFFSDLKSLMHHYYNNKVFYADKAKTDGPYKFKLDPLQQRGWEAQKRWEASGTAAYGKRRPSNRRTAKKGPKIGSKRHNRGSRRPQKKSSRKGSKRDSSKKKKKRV